MVEEKKDKHSSGLRDVGLDYQISLLLNRNDLSEGDLPVPTFSGRRIAIVSVDSASFDLEAKLNELFQSELIISLLSISDLIASMKSGNMEEQFDLVMLYVSNPAMWQEPLNKLKSAIPELPVALLSHIASNDLAIDAFAQGAVDYILIQEDVQAVGNSMLLCVERVKAQQLKRASMKLEKQAIRDAFEHSPVFMVRIDTQFQVRDCNEPFASAISSTVTALKGRCIFEVFGCLDVGIIERVFASGKPRKTRVRIEKQGTRESFWDLLIWPIYRTLGSSTEAIIAGIDVSDDVNLELERDEFVVSLAHDLRNPLVGHEMVLAKMMERADSQADRDCFRVLQESNKHLLTLLDNLMSIFSGAGKVDKSSIIDAGAILEAQVDIVSQVASFAGKKIKLSIKSESTFVFGEESSLVRIFSNLLFNALKHSSPGSEIEIALFEMDENSLVLEICNESISDADLGAKLFEKFAGVRDAKPHSSGYGLYLTRKLVKGLSGEISYRRHGNLCIFNVTLPRAELDI